MMAPLPSSPIAPGRIATVAPLPQRTVAVAPIRTAIITTAGLARKTADWSSDSVAASAAAGNLAARRPAAIPTSSAQALHLIGRLLVSQAWMHRLGFQLHRIRGARRHECVNSRPDRRLRPTDAGLDVTHQVPLEIDLDLVVLDLPVADRGEPAEGAAAVGHHPLSPVDERPRLAGRQPLVLLGMRAEEPQDLLVGRHAGTDPLERIAGRNRAALPAGLGRSPHVNARSERPGEPPPQREEERTGKIPEPEQKRRDQDGPPWQPAREVGEPDFQLLWRQAF